MACNLSQSECYLNYGKKSFILLVLESNAQTVPYGDTNYRFNKRRPIQVVQQVCIPMTQRCDGIVDIFPYDDNTTYRCEDKDWTWDKSAGTHIKIFLLDRLHFLRQITADKWADTYICITVGSHIKTFFLDRLHLFFILQQTNGLIYMYLGYSMKKLLVGFR